MTEAKILQRQPSIQAIEIKAQPNSELSSSDVKRLFVGQTLPRFQLTDIKSQTAFCKRDKARVFISLLESWNKRIDESQQCSMNSRTEFLLMEFIYSSVRRASLMSQTEVEKQLNILYSWFTNQTKNNPMYMRATMPIKKRENQYYNVMKTFKTNPATIIDQYRRPDPLLRSPQKLIKPAKQQSSLFSQLQPNLQMKKSANNFITQVQKQNSGPSSGQDKENIRCFLLKKQSYKLREDELRNYIEKKQMEQQQWQFRIKKGRLQSESIKNYFSANLNTGIVRNVKTSQGNRDNKERDIINEVKKMRIHTSSGKRVLNTLSVSNGSNKMPEVTEICHFGLMSNPFQVKMKKKHHTKGKLKKI